MRTAGILSSAQVQAHYAAGACGGGPLPGPADSPLSASGGWLPLTQPSNTLIDLSGRNAPALLGGTPPAYGWDTTLTAECIEQENVCLCQPDTILVAANAYRYGFNGMERDSELGEDDYDFGARLYDADYGRWYTVDPLAWKYPEESSYLAFGANPIAFKDPNGREKIIAFDKKSGNDKNKISGAEKYVDDGAIHIFSHGASWGIIPVVGGVTVEISTPEHLNEFLKEHSEIWNKKDGNSRPVIVLHACNTAVVFERKGESFAETVSKSDLFKDAKIIAADNLVYTSEEGEIGVYGSKVNINTGDEVRDATQKGSWRVYENGVQTEQFKGDWKPKENPGFSELLYYSEPISAKENNNDNSKKSKKNE